MPKLTHEECMDLILDVRSDAELHRKASQGYKKVGQSIGILGKEDNQIVREAAKYWNEETTDGHLNRRHNKNAEIAEVAEHVVEKHIVRSEAYVRRLICDYPRRPKSDFVVQNLGEEFAHDSIKQFERR